MWLFMKVCALNEFISATALLFTAYSFFSLETSLKLNLTFVFSILQIHYTMVLLGEVPLVILPQLKIWGVKAFYFFSRFSAGYDGQKMGDFGGKRYCRWQKVLSVDKALSFA